MSNLAKHILTHEDKDTWLAHHINRTSSWVEVRAFNPYVIASLPFTFEGLLYPSFNYTDVELHFNCPGTGIGTIYGYSTKSVLHLLDYIFSQLPPDFTRDELQRAAYRAMYGYEYDGSVYLNREESEALHYEMTTCKICGARNVELNAHNTCRSYECESELDRILEGM